MSDKTAALTEWVAIGDQRCQGSEDLWPLSICRGILVIWLWLSDYTSVCACIVAASKAQSSSHRDPIDGR